MWHYSIAYFGMAVPLLVWEKAKVYMAETYYIPFIVLYGVYFAVMEMRTLGKLIKKEEAEHSVHVKEHKKEHKKLE